MSNTAGREPSPAPAADTPDDTPDLLEAMRRRLLEHPPLEDLGPLFGPQAQGRPAGGNAPAHH